MWFDFDVQFTLIDGYSNNEANCGFYVNLNNAVGNTHGRALDFMGFKFYRNRTTLRHNIMLRASKKARRIKKTRRGEKEARGTKKTRRGKKEAR